MPRVWRAGFRDCWFYAEVIGETRPYESGIFVFLVINNRIFKLSVNTFVQ